jgi:hypothetical protein
MRMRGQAGFFDVDEPLKQLSAKGDSLERLSAVVDFELFRADLERAVPLPSSQTRGAAVGIDRQFPDLKFLGGVLYGTLSLSHFHQIKRRAGGAKSWPAIQRALAAGRRSPSRRNTSRLPFQEGFRFGHCRRAPKREGASSLRVRRQGVGRHHVNR